MREKSKKNKAKNTLKKKQAVRTSLNRKLLTETKNGKSEKNRTFMHDFHHNVIHSRITVF